MTFLPACCQGLYKRNASTFERVYLSPIRRKAQTHTHFFGTLISQCFSFCTLVLGDPSDNLWFVQDTGERSLFTESSPNYFSIYEQVYKSEDNGDVKCHLWDYHKHKHWLGQTGIRKFVIYQKSKPKYVHLIQENTNIRPWNSDWPA